MQPDAIDFDLVLSMNYKGVVTVPNAEVFKIRWSKGKYSIFSAFKNKQDAFENLRYS